ncbi:MAG TPA: cyclase family protein [Spirillospora sp.]|nr:cyclase family protein [Spirillospora sp.]
MIYDITRKVTPTLPVWPGDTPFRVDHVLRRTEGGSVNLTTLTMTAHLGTHADAYYHFSDNGSFAGDMPLEAYIGPARVVTVSKTDGPLLPEDVGHIAGVERLLIHSAVSDLEEVWPEQFPYLSVELIEWLAANGVRLVGLDSPSVDAFDSQDLPCHHALQQHNMVNLESLLLRNVPDGDYELIALPLRLDGACGSPVRAILREFQSGEA